MSSHARPRPRRSMVSTPQPRPEYSTVASPLFPGYHWLSMVSDFGCFAFHMAGPWDAPVSRADESRRCVSTLLVSPGQY